jgi:hypothetical protein
MPTNPFDSFMAQPGQPKKEVSPNPFANSTAPAGPPGVASSPIGRPPSGAAPGPAAPLAPAPASSPAAPAKPASPAQPAQPGGGVTIQVGQPQQQSPAQPEQQTKAPPPPAPDAPELVDPATGQLRQVSTPEDRVEFGRQLAARQAKYGPTPFGGDPNAPKPIIRLGKPAYNPFTGTFS